MKTTPLNKIILIISILLTDASIRAQVNLQWVKSITGDVRTPYITSDASGNLYTCTTFSGTVDFDPGAGVFNLTSTNSSEDVYIQKLDINGNFIWAKAFGNINQEILAGFEVDDLGNCYLTGRFKGTVDFDPNVGVYNLSSNTVVPFLSAFIVKFNSSGNLVWAKSTGEAGFGIELDAQGNIYVCGIFTGIADLNPGTAVYNVGQTNAISYFILKLDNTGNFLWGKANTSNGTSAAGLGTYYTKPIGIDPTGNVYVAGEFDGTWDFNPGSAVSNLTSLSSFKDIFIQKLDSNGNLIWVKHEGGSGSDYLSSVSLDANGNIYVLGNYSQTVDFDPGSGVFNLTTIGNPNFIQKLDANANLLWAKTVHDSIEISSITVDNSGNLYLCGAFTSTSDFDFGLTFVNVTSNGSYDYFIQKVDGNSNFIWAKTFGNNMIDVGLDLRIDNQNSIYITGFYTGTVDFDPNGGITNLNSSTSASDMFIHKLTQGTSDINTNINFLNTINIFPNPSSNNWNVSFSNANYTIGSMELNDIAGKIVWSYDFSNRQNEDITIPNATLSSGIYFLKTKTDVGYDVQKLIKQ